MNENNGALREMPKYRCHKEVWALKIKDVALTRCINGPIKLLFDEDSGFYPIEVSKEFYDKHKPKAGGYYVVYKDGYKSFSPADAFEDGYTKI